MSSSNRGYIPTVFTKYGKSSKDLFKKKYEYDHTIKTINKSSRKGVSIESGATFVENGAGIRGFIKSKYSAFPVNSLLSGAEFEGELNTDAAVESKANIKFNNLAKGLTVNLLTSSKPSDKAFKKPIGSVELEYSTDYIATTGTIKSDLDVHRGDASISIGYDNISIGGNVVVDISRGSDIIEHNIGGEYIGDDFVASVYTEKNSTSLVASYFQRLSRDNSNILGAQFKYELNGRQDRSLSIGSEYKLDLDTTIKGKIDLPSGDIATVIEHRLANPRLLFGLAAQFNAKAQRFQADKLGVSITFGDY
jgi:hypothetical protein